MRGRGTLFWAAVIRVMLRYPRAALRDAGMSHHAADHPPHNLPGHGHDHSPHHSHGIIDPAIASTDRGMWALKWSFIGLLATALFQLVVVVISGSVALFADTLHNFADAATAIPLAIAFAFARLRPTRRFPYGYGRVEDLAGVLIVVTILITALIAAYESLLRLLRPQPVGYLWAVAVASVIGFLGNEAEPFSGSRWAGRSAALPW
jgi:Co/Zn/Cd efflux system component